MAALQKRLAARILKSSPNRMKFDESALDDIKGAITKASVRGLIKSGAITEAPAGSASRGRIRAALLQKRKGRGKGPTRRKGKATARAPRKEEWMNKVRLLRATLKQLLDSDQIDEKVYRMLYMKIKGGFFRSKRHLNLYLAEQELVKKK